MLLRNSISNYYCIKTDERLEIKKWDIVQTLPMYPIFHHQASPKGGIKTPELQCLCVSKHMRVLRSPSFPSLRARASAEPLRTVISCPQMALRVLWDAQRSPRCLPVAGQCQKGPGGFLHCLGAPWHPNNRSCLCLDISIPGRCPNEFFSIH